MQKITASLSFVAAFAFIKDARAGILDSAGPVGVGDKIILLDSLAIMLAVIVPVIVMTLLFAWWFRASNLKAKYLPDWEYSGRIELVVWSIPLMIILFLGGVAWIGSHELDPQQTLASKQKPLKVDVVSIDWKWLFIYPEQNIASINQLAIPVGVPVEFNLTAADVMNSFFIPRLGSQIYTMPGMVTALNLEATKSGTFPGLSAQFSGDGFSDMRFNTLALPPDQFTKWIAAARSSGVILDETAYSKLVQPSRANPVVTYSGVEPDLFNKIIALSAPGTVSEPKTSTYTKD